jgi:hypothetical protein
MRVIFRVNTFFETGPVLRCPTNKWGMIAFSSPMPYKTRMNGRISAMRNKLYAAGAALLFIAVAWSYFETPEPPIKGLVRPQIDSKLFDSAAPVSPAAAAAKARADQRKERMEQKKGQQAGKEETGEKPGLLGRLFGKNKAAAGNGADKQMDKADRPGQKPSTINKRSPAAAGNKRDFLAKRREERKARREAMLNASKGRTAPPAANLKAQGNGGDDEGSVPDEPLPEIEDEVPQDVAMPSHDGGAETEE